MPAESSWSLIERAVAGDPDARCDFAAKYLPIVRSYLLARWHGKPILNEIEDAVQDVFVDCLRESGALTRAEDRGSGFRRFLFGVTRNVAQRTERECAQLHDREQGADTALATFAGNETSLAGLFDREWAKTVMRAAMSVQEQHARESGADAERRVELLRLRYQDDLPIREIARHWQVEAAWLHHQHEQAKREFRRAWCCVMGLQKASEAQIATEWGRFIEIFGRHGEARERTEGHRPGASPSSQPSDALGAL